MAGVKLPANTTIDGHSYAPVQLWGKWSQFGDWAFIQLYVRDGKFKFNQSGVVVAISNATFEEPWRPLTVRDPACAAARLRMRAVLDQLIPTRTPDAEHHANRDDGRKKERRP